MQNENRNEGCACCVAVVMVLMLIACMLCSCKTRYITQTEYEYKEVPVVMHDTITQKLYSHDTTIVRDSVIIQQKGDTVFCTKFKDVYKTKIVHDTTTNVIEKPVSVYQTTEKIIPEIIYKQKWWQSVLTWLGGIALVTVLLYIATKIKR